MVPACGESQGETWPEFTAQCAGGCSLRRPQPPSVAPVLDPGKGSFGVQGWELSGWVLRPFLDLSFPIRSPWTAEVFIVLTEVRFCWPESSRTIVCSRSGPFRAERAPQGRVCVLRKLCASWLPQGPLYPFAHSSLTCPVLGVERGCSLRPTLAEGEVTGKEVQGSARGLGAGPRTHRCMPLVSPRTQRSGRD